MDRPNHDHPRWAGCSPLGGHSSQLCKLAVDDVLLRTTGPSVQFTAQALLTNDLGAAPLTLSGVAATSAGGGTITDLGGGNYQYNPPLFNPDAPDQFTYQLQAADSTSAAGTARVAIQLAPVPPPNNSPVQLLPYGQLRLHFSQLDPGQTYRLEAASQLAGPWFRVASFLIGPSGVIEYIDTPPPSLSDRYYRTVKE
jgi:hypothetical protein